MGRKIIFALAVIAICTCIIMAITVWMHAEIIETSTNTFIPANYDRNNFDAQYHANTPNQHYSWIIKSEDIFYQQIFLGEWLIHDMVPVEFSVPSIYSGFDVNNNFKGQDLLDNIVGQVIFFGGDYVENNGVVYNLEKNYETYCVAITSDDTRIGSNTAGTLGFDNSILPIVFYTISDKKDMGERNITNLNQLYIKDANTIYASIDGCVTFMLKRTQ